jgi:hypothetical protein
LISRLDILQQPLWRDFFGRAFFFGGAGGTVAHGGERVLKETALLSLPTD